MANGRAKEPLGDRRVDAKIYKGKAGAQFSLSLPYLEVEGTKERPRQGCVFVTVAPATKPREYNWEDKIIMTLDPVELAQCAFALRGEGFASNEKIFHDPNIMNNQKGQIAKTLTIKLADDGNYLLQIQEGDKTREEQNRRYTVPITPYEADFLANLFTVAQSKILGWS
jgi:glycine cleavage system H lipoate-binding protein